MSNSRPTKARARHRQHAKHCALTPADLDAVRMLGLFRRLTPRDQDILLGMAEILAEVGAPGNIDDAEARHE